MGFILIFIDTFSNIIKSWAKYKHPPYGLASQTWGAKIILDNILRISIILIQTIWMRGKNMDIRSPADCPYYLISRAALAITSFLRKGLFDAGAGNIKPAYLGVLLSLWNEDNLRANELGKRAGLEPSSMTGLLDRMEKDGLLKRAPDPEDRRAFRILLTPLGVKAEKASMEAVSKALDRVFIDISDKDIHTVKKVLRKVWINCSKE